MFTTLLTQANPHPLGPFGCIGAFCPSELGGTTSSPMVIDNLFSTIVGFLTIVGGLAFLIYFMIGALSWITGGDDKTKVDAAKKYMTNGVIGLIAIIAAYAIVWIVGSILGIRILSPGDVILNTFGNNPRPGTFPPPTTIQPLPVR